MAVPLIIGAAAAALPGMIGKGKSGYQAYDFSKTDAYDPNAHRFGPNGAQSYAENRGARAAGIDRRAPPTTNYQHVDYARAQGQAARAAQAQAANMMMDRAAGRVPSIAQQQADRQMAQLGRQSAYDMQRATSAQASMAAGARGPAALALAQQQRANNTANAQSGIARSNQMAGQNISEAAQVNAANERLQAEQAAFGAQSAIRGQDYGAMGQEAGMAQGDARIALDSRNANDARAMGYEQMGHQAYGAEQQGKVATQGQIANSHAAGQGMNASTAMGNANNSGIFDTIGDWFSDRRAKYVMSDFTAKQPFDLTAMVPKGGETAVGGGGDSGGMMSMLSMMGKGGLAGGGASMMSDARAKREAFLEGARFGTGVAQGHKPEPPEYARDSFTRLDDPKRPKDDAEEAPRAYVMGARTDSPQAIDANLARAGWAKPPARHESDAATAEERAMRLAAATPPDLHRNLQAAGWTPPGAHRAAPPMAQSAPMPAPDMRAGMSFSSDFDSKAPLMQFDPSRGWHNPEQYDARQRLTNAMEEQAERDRVEAEHDARVAAMPARRSSDPAVGLERVGEMRRQRELTGEGLKAPTLAQDEPTASDGKPMAPGTADFMATQPKGEDGKPSRPWWAGKGDEDFGVGGQLMAGLKMGGALSNAQFGSDFSSKEAIDLDEPTYDLDEQDVDLDKPAPGASMRDGASDPRTNRFDKSFRRDTPKDQAKVKRAFEDRAGAEADRMLASFRARTGADESGIGGKALASRMSPSDSPVAEANRTMQGEPYVYKPEFTPPDQEPGEPNFGFMAQNLEKSPITATAVKEDANGMKRVDALKLMRVYGASIADLQKQQDETRLMLAKGGRRK